MLPVCAPKKLYVVTVGSRKKWIDYIPVKNVAGSKNIGFTVIGSIAGLKEWIDYIPVVASVAADSYADTTHEPNGFCSYA